jgi:predicted molibdopterin-dependent oxidoreductase YjgC
MSQSLTLNGRTVTFEAGETLLNVCEREAVKVPTLCYDPRLDPVGACRTCLVEVEGQRRLIPSCTTPATDGMVVTTETDRVARHRKVLFSMYLADTEGEALPGAPSPANRLWDLSEEAGASSEGWLELAPQRPGRLRDDNPYIAFQPDRCILCACCTRYCDEVESVSAITLANRGPETTIATTDGASLLDTTCELCGGCVDVCPTGAMTERRELGVLPVADKLEVVRTTCGYCGVGCQMDLYVDSLGNGGRGRITKVRGAPAGTLPNDGNLCVKGRFAFEFVDHEDRLTTPLIRDTKGGPFREASWEEALARAAAALGKVKERDGADALAVVSSSRCTGEENFLAQKFARAVLGTNNIHQCAAT